MSGYDAVVVGSGPNGLAAAAVLSLAGRSVLVREADETIGGGARSAPLTSPGFIHDVCSAVHPLAVASPFFRALPLAAHGLEWIHPALPLAHPFDDGSAVPLARSTVATAAALGQDASAYRDLMDPLVASWVELLEDVLAPLRVPRHPLTFLRFARHAIRSALGLAESVFTGERARTLFAGMAAHSFLPLTNRASAAFGLVLGASGHAVGWPFPKGGAQEIAGALAAYIRSLGGEIVTAAPVRSLTDLPPARAVLLDVTPRQLLRIAGERLPARYRRRLRRFRYGPAVFKVDWALSAPIPWRAPECARSGTLHLGGGWREVAAAEAATWRGDHAEKPFVLLAQPSLFDSSRAPAGKHTAWAYCHVPHGSRVDMTARIEAQVERFAPGFRDVVLARSSLGAAELERHNPNLVGGDINGGALDLRQLLFRPMLRRCPYSTPLPGVYLCSASTPPGPGVHGMCGYFAAHAALARDLR